MDTILRERLTSDGTITGLVSTRINPSRPTNDTTLPYVVYTLQDVQPFNNLDGISTLRQYTYTVEYWSVTQSTNIEVGNAVFARLNGWRDDTVQGCFLQSWTDEPDELGRHGVQTYAIFA